MIVSADGHAGAPGNLYRDYLDPEFRELFDDFVGQSREMQKVMFAERDNSPSRKKWRVKWYEETGDGGERVAYDSDRRNAALDEDGVAAEVLFPDADASGLGWSEVVGAPFGSGLSSSGASDPRLVFAGARSAQPLARGLLSRVAAATRRNRARADRARRRSRARRDPACEGVGSARRDHDSDPVDGEGCVPRSRVRRRSGSCASSSTCRYTHTPVPAPRTSVRTRQ